MGVLIAAPNFALSNENFPTREDFLTISPQPRMWGGDNYFRGSFLLPACSSASARREMWNYGLAVCARATTLTLLYGGRCCAALKSVHFVVGTSIIVRNISLPAALL